MTTAQKDKPQAAEKQTDFRQEFTNAVVAAIESGQKLPWDKPWVALSNPSNAVSGKEYNGMNRLILGMRMLDKGYTDPRFVTFKQALDLGGAVNKGEKGTQIERWDEKPFWKRSDVVLSAAGVRVTVDSKRGVTADGVHLVGGQVVPKDRITVTHEQRTDAGVLARNYTWQQAEKSLNLLVGRAYTVFNVEQCQGLKLSALPERPRLEPEARLVSIQRAMTEQTGLQFKPGAAAMYVPALDTVVTPAPSAFKSLGDYQSTMLHEIGHATGAEKRLNRATLTAPDARFGSQTYAKEELRAELFSAFAAMETGITRTRDEQHHAYLQSWAQVLKKDKNEIFRAAADAAKAVDYVIVQERALGLTVAAPQVPAVPAVEDRGPSMHETLEACGWRRTHGSYEKTFLLDKDRASGGEFTRGQEVIERVLSAKARPDGFTIEQGWDDIRVPVPDGASAAQAVAELDKAAKQCLLQAHRHLGVSEIRGKNDTQPALEPGLKSIAPKDIRAGHDLVDEKGRMSRVLDVGKPFGDAFITTEKDLDTGTPFHRAYRDDTTVRVTTRSLDLVAQTLSRQPQELTLAEFASTATAHKLGPGHGRQWEVFHGSAQGGRSLGFADGPTAEGAVQQVHRREVNNALYDNAAGTRHPAGVEPRRLPPQHVLDEYPDLAQKFAPALATAAPAVPNPRVERIEDTRRATGTLLRVSLAQEPGRDLLHMTRAGSDIAVSVPAGTAQDIQPGTPIRVQFNAKKGLQVEAGKSPARGMGR